MSRRNKLLVGIGAVVLAGALVAVSAGARRDKGIEVRFEQVGQRDLVAAVTASGKIQPKRSVDVSADITGRIVKLSVEEGAYVQQGQFLLQIDPTIYEANLQRARAAVSSSEAALVQARANRDQARRGYDRTKELQRQSPNLVTAEQVELAQTQYDVARAQASAAEFQVSQSRAAMQEATDQLSKTRIIAPMAGRVTRLAVEEGEVAVPGTFSRETGLLLTISDLSVIQVVVQVDETDVVRLALGDSVEISIDAFPDTNFVGRVSKISDSAIRTAAASAGATTDQAVDYEVEITLEAPPGDIRPDLSATARIVTDTRTDALAIPIIALTVRPHAEVSTEARPADTTAAGQQKKETEGVFVVTDGVATFRPVRVGIAGDEYFEVIEGVKEGETIVAGPYQSIRDLKDGAHVRQAKQPADSARRAAS
jgi:HlyD family secretion protein